MKFLTVAECTRRNGERHLANAVSYASRGMMDYSDGSMRKAARNFARAGLLEPPVLPPWMQAALDAMRHHIDLALLRDIGGR